MSDTTTRGEKNLRNEWDDFFAEHAHRIFTEKNYIIDIGGTLGLRPDKNNRSKKETEFLIPYLSRVTYTVLDVVPDYNPDIVGDIQALPLDDESVDAIFCCSVLEHVLDPKKGVEEIYRVLKPGGYAYFYAPFLFYYHAMPGYYGDYWRITADGWEYLVKDFNEKKIAPVHGPFGTILNMIPGLSKKASILKPLDRWLKPSSRQVSGYNVFCVK